MSYTNCDFLSLIQTLSSTTWRSSLTTSSFAAVQCPGQVCWEGGPVAFFLHFANSCFVDRAWLQIFWECIHRSARQTLLDDRCLMCELSLLFRMSRKRVHTRVCVCLGVGNTHVSNLCILIQTRYLSPVLCFFIYTPPRFLSWYSISHSLSPLPSFHSLVSPLYCPLPFVVG